MTQATPSVQGGVVSEPRYRQIVRNGGNSDATARALPEPHARFPDRAADAPRPAPARRFLRLPRSAVRPPRASRPRCDARSGAPSETGRRRPDARWRGGNGTASARGVRRRERCRGPVPGRAGSCGPCSRPRCATGRSRIRPVPARPAGRRSGRWATAPYPGRTRCRPHPAFPTARVRCTARSPGAPPDFPSIAVRLAVRFPPSCNFTPALRPGCSHPYPPHPVHRDTTPGCRTHRDVPGTGPSKQVPRESGECAQSSPAAPRRAGHDEKIHGLAKRSTPLSTTGPLEFEPERPRAARRRAASEQGGRRDTPPVSRAPVRVSYTRMETYLMVVNSSMPQCPPSRPSPLSPIPPMGTSAPCGRRSFTPTKPQRKAAAVRNARPRSRV